jgi:glycosyltransferase involved in cell wall biosynthesis
VYGHEEEDRLLGSAGAVVGINDPKALAEAALDLLLSPERWRAARDAAIARVGRFYTKERMVSAYRTLYEKGVSDWRG